MDNRFFEQSVLICPYEYPPRHWELDAEGQPTQRIIESRRTVEFTPIPKPKKRKGSRVKKMAFAFDEGKGLSTVEQQYDPTPIINELRKHIDLWRARPDPSDWQVPYRYGSETRTYLPDFIVLVDDGHEDPLHLVVEVKGYRREDAKEKKATMETYWVPGVNNLGRYGRWAFAEFTEVYQIEADFKEKVESQFNQMIERITPEKAGLLYVQVASEYSLQGARKLGAIRR